jgi:hypothetical protein
MDGAVLRAWWAARQGLDGSLRGARPGAVLERSGWARSVGGVGPYLTLSARAGTSREEADAAVAALEIHELPSARGCTYVVPAADYALALALAEEAGGAELRTALKLGVTEAEIERLCAKVVDVLGDAALGPDEIRDAVGDAARSLGEAGAKKGMSTTLPTALGLLQERGEIRRVPTNGRLDQQRYRYVRWTPNPRRAFAPGEAAVELARRWFRWTGPATLAEFQWFSGLGVKAAKAAVAPLGLVPLEGTDRLLFPDDLDALRAFRAPAEPRYALVGSLDALFLLRRDVRSLLDPADVARYEATAPDHARAGASLSDLSSHAIVDRGRLVGLWEFDPEAGEIAWTSFVPRDEALRAAVAETERAVRDQLGDARTFSLDSPKSRAPRLAALRAAP